MFKFLFINRHREHVLDYIRLVYDGSQSSGRRFVLPKFNSREVDPNIRYSLREIDSKEDDSTTLYSERDGGETSVTGSTESDVRYSERDSGQDRFDPELVAMAMRSHLAENFSAKPLSSVTNLTFVQKLQHYIYKSGLVEAQVYKAALMDRRLFSKIISNKDYKPSKDTALALIFALKLGMEEAVDLLERAGYTLSHSIRRDIIIEYFIKERIYNLNNINAFLYNMNEKIIGRGV